MTGNWVTGLAANNSAIFALEYSDLFRTTDSGKNWEQLSWPTPGTEITAIYLNMSNIVLWTGSGIFIS